MGDAGYQGTQSEIDYGEKNYLRTHNLHCMKLTACHSNKDAIKSIKCMISNTTKQLLHVFLAYYLMLASIYELMQKYYISRQRFLKTYSHP